MKIGHRKEFVSWRFERFAHSLQQTTKTQKFSLESLKPVYSRSLPKKTNKQTNKIRVRKKAFKIRMVNCFAQVSIFLSFVCPMIRRE